MSILMFINIKGGVAKTTNAVAVAECLADSGYNTLLIDADHQCTAGDLLLGETRFLRCERRRKTLHDMLAAMLDDEFKAEHVGNYIEEGASDIRQGMANLSVLPCSIRIDDFQTNMAKARHGFRSREEFQGIFERRRRSIRTWLNREYDFTIIDCPPSVALQVKVFLPIANAFIIPSVPDRLSVRSSLWLLDRVRRSGVKTPPLGILWSLYRKQIAMHKHYVEAVSRRVKPLDQLPRPFKTVIPNATAIAATTEPNQAPRSFIAKYSPQFARLYQDLCREMISRCQEQEKAALEKRVTIT